MTVPQKKRILFLITSLTHGGAQTQLILLSQRLVRRGWKVKLVSVMPPQAYVDEFQGAGVPVATLGVRRKAPNPWPVIRLLQEISQWRPQIVHSHLVHANLFARLVRPWVRVPVMICTAHNIYEGGRLREWLYRFTDPFCDLTTQVSRAGRARYIAIKASPSHKIRYIPNGIDTRRFQPNPQVRLALRRALGVENHFLFLSIGRLAPEKDYPNLLHAFAQVVPKAAHARLFIVGDGPLKPAMQDLAQRLGIDAQVRFLGTRRDVANLMNAADAFVVSSAWEGMPMVLLEAAASGLPAVATDVGDNRAIVLDGQTGFLAPPHQAETLAEAMLRLMALPEPTRRRMGERARAHVQANFDIERVVDQWEDLYQRLLQKQCHEAC